MAKVGQKDISMALAKKKGMDMADGERYVDTFFSLIEEALLTEKIVKVKGLGTFKLVDVRDRESVDVNTGDRVVIDGHAKVSFQPDPTLKELVNKPFSQFETVMLNDGVSFDNVAGDDADSDGNGADSADHDGAESETVEAAGNGSEADPYDGNMADTNDGNAADNAAEEIIKPEKGKSLISGALAEASQKLGTLADGNAEASRKLGTLAGGKTEASRKLDTLADENARDVAGNQASATGKRISFVEEQGGHSSVQGASAEIVGRLADDSGSDNIPDNVTFSTSMDADTVADENNSGRGNTVTDYKLPESTVTHRQEITETHSCENTETLRPESMETNRKESVGTVAGEPLPMRATVGNAVPADDEDEGEMVKSHSVAKVVLCVAAAIAVLVAMFYVGYSMGESNKAAEMAEQKTAQVSQRKSVKRVVKKPATVADTAVRHEEPLPAVAEDGKAPQEKAEKEQEKTAAESTAAPEEAKDGNKMAEAKLAVKTGAYSIEGTDKSIRLKPGQTLERVSRTYLGEGMECYVMVHNGKTQFKPGESINIPKLKLKKKATNKKVS